MNAAILSIAAIIAVINLVLVFRETRRRQAAQEFYVSPITMFRRELSLAGICTIATVIIWVVFAPSSVRLAAGAFLPAFLYFFLRTSPDRK